MKYVKVKGIELNAGPRIYPPDLVYVNINLIYIFFPKYLTIFPCVTLVWLY